MYQTFKKSWDVAKYFIFTGIQQDIKYRKDKRKHPSS